MNIDELQAGRGLDVLIAEGIMGWIRLSFDCAQGPPGSTREDWRWMLVSPESRSPQSFFCHIATEDEPAMVGWDKNVPSYSTDISAAWQVVEKMRATPKVFLAFAIAVEELCNAENDLSYRAIETVLRAIDPFIICRAALKAVEK